MTINQRIQNIARKLYRPYEGIFGSATPPEYIVKTLTGNGYIDLTNAIANSLQYVKAFGGINQSNLPVGYTELDGITGDGSAYLDLNCSLDQDDEIEIDFTAKYGSGTQIFGYRSTASSQNITLFSGGSSNSIFEDFNNSDYAPYRLSGTLTYGTKYFATMSKSERKIVDNSGTTIATNSTACSDTITTGNVYLFFAGGSPSGTGKFQGTIHRCFIKGKRNLIPCKNSSNVVGMYDTINDVFYENANEIGSFVAGNNVLPTPTSPQNITCNNGILKYGPLGNNLYNPNHVLIVLGYYVNASDGVVMGSATNFLINSYIPIKPNTSYVFYGRNKDTNRMSSYNRIAFFDENKTFIVTGSYTKDKIGIGTSPANAKYVLLSCNPSGESAVGGTPVDIEYIDGYNRTFREGTAETTFEPYVGGIYSEGITETIKDTLNNTATAEMLLGIGNNKDIQEILTGNVTRKIGIKVLDGSENIGKSSQYAGSFFIRNFVTDNGTSNLSQFMITHFQTETVENQYAIGKSILLNNALNMRRGQNNTPTIQDFSDRLAGQYQSGTPVIVAYILNTPTTETVTGQTLDIQDGTNKIEITQASISNLPLEIQFHATS